MIGENVMALPDGRRDDTVVPLGDVRGPIFDGWGAYVHRTTYRIRAQEIVNIERVTNEMLPPFDTTLKFADGTRMDTFEAWVASNKVKPGDYVLVVDGEWGAMRHVPRDVFHRMYQPAPTVAEDDGA
jgi:hypothetical protein